MLGRNKIRTLSSTVNWDFLDVVILVYLAPSIPSTDYNIRMSVAKRTVRHILALS